jgi:predicted transport protein
MMEHSDKAIADFLQNKSAASMVLFDKLVATFKEIGPVEFHAAKTMIAFSSRINFAYVIQMGKDFIDIVLPFKQPYEDNLCFRKIKAVPGSDDYNHHLRIYLPEDLNEEVVSYLRMAYENGK